MTTIDTLRDRYDDVKHRIARAAARSGRLAESVVLVAVSKYSGFDEIRELMALGQRDFGESQIQQLIQRSAMLDEWQSRQRRLGVEGAAAAVPQLARAGPSASSGGAGVKSRADAGGELLGARGEGAAATGAGPAEGGSPVRWHMIGHLQRNKVRKAVELSRLIHGVDSLRLAEEIQATALKLDRVVEVLLQVNVSGESTKFGIAPAAAPHMAEALETMLNVRLRGLMTMAPHTDDPEAARPVFARARELFEEIASSGAGGPHFSILSMGMSHDFEVAVSEGANLVRVGSAIFGEAPPPPTPLPETGDGAGLGGAGEPGPGSAEA